MLRCEPISALPGSNPEKYASGCVRPLATLCRVARMSPISSAASRFRPSTSRKRSCVEIAAGHFADEEEVGLAEVGGELLDRAAEVAALLEGHVLERVDAEAVAVGERDPVFVALGQVVKHAGVARARNRAESKKSVRLCSAFGSSRLPAPRSPFPARV